MRAPTAKPGATSSLARPVNQRTPNSPPVKTPWANLAGSGKTTALGSDVTWARAGAPPTRKDVVNAAAAISFASRRGVNGPWSHHRRRLEQRGCRLVHVVGVIVPESIVVVADANVIFDPHRHVGLEPHVDLEHRGH